MQTSRCAHTQTKPAAARPKPFLSCGLIAACAAAMALGIAGCREKTQAQRTFEDAVRRLTTGPTGERNAEAYASVASALTAAPGAAANDPAVEELTLLRGVARSSEGIAALAALDEAIAEAGVMLERAESHARTRGVEHQIAEAAASVNYEATNQRLAAEIQTLERQAADLRSQRASIRSRVSDLASQAASLDEQAAALRERAADRQLAASASPVQAAEAAPEVRRINRQADALEQRSARLRIAASTAEAEIPLIEARIEQRSRQRELLEGRIETNRTRAAEAQERANAALAAAAEAETDLQAALDAARAAAGFGPASTQNGTAGVLAPAERAVRAFESAISDARRARAHAPARANIGVTVAARLLGETNQRLLTSLERVEFFIRDLVAARPPLDNADELRTLLARVRERANTAASDAAEAYDTAASALRALRASDQRTRQSLSQAADRYQELAASFRQPTEDENSGGDPAGAPGRPQQGDAAGAAPGAAPGGAPGGRE